VSRRAPTAPAALWAVAVIAAVVTLLAGCGATSQPAGIDTPAFEAATGPVVLARATASTAALINHSAPAADLFGAQWCAATLTTATTLITARHCVKDRRPKSLDVVLAADNLCNNAPITGERIQIKSIRILPDATLDLAVLTTTRPATTTPTPIAAPAIGQPGTALVAVGWGRRSSNGPAPCRKQAVPLRLAGADKCSPARAANPEQWNPLQLCATAAPGAERNTCSGDSGGPVYQTTPDRPRHLRLVAVINWGTGCQPDQPGFYTPAELSTAAN
jgi:secreted trypsin-like serine protease